MRLAKYFVYKPKRENCPTQKFTSEWGNACDHYLVPPILVTVLSNWFVTQMLVPSKAIP